MQKAFTLAEILITLAIIGVVAAMTIPVLTKRAEEQETVAKVKKYYSTISNAVKLWEVENGCIGDIELCISEYPVNDCKNAFKGVEEKLNIVDRVYNGVNLSAADWLPSRQVLLTGANQGTAWTGVSKVSTSSVNTCHYLFQDGATMMVALPDNFHQSGFIFLDVNGKKMPNRVGKDTFPIGLGSYNNPKYKDVNPYYAEDSAGGTYGHCAIRNGGICSADSASSPTAYVLKNGKLPTLSPP